MPDARLMRIESCQQTSPRRAAPRRVIKLREANPTSRQPVNIRRLNLTAESADIPLEDEERAAKAAGFEGVSAISPYLRSLILQHHDTLAGAVR